jgi:hypothetical protein
MLEKIEGKSRIDNPGTKATLGARQKKNNLKR